MNKQETYISRGNKPWWKLIFSAICFTAAIYIAHQAFYKYVPSRDTSTTAAIVITSMSMLPLIVLGIVFSMVKDFHFDFLKKRYKIVKRVGPFGYGKWQKFESLNYISIYENLDGFFEIKMWYNKNRHYTIDIFKKEQDAVKTGKELAGNLAINLYTPKKAFEYFEDESEPKEIPDELRVIDAHISEGKRPLWKLIIAILLFTGALVSLYIFYKTLSFNIDEKRITAYIDILYITATLSGTALSFAVVRDYQFDFKNNEYKIIYRVGPIKVGKWQSFKSIDYISVFNKNDSIYLVNLWYNTNKHFNLGKHKKAEDAIYAGRELSKKLKINLLDATNPRKTKWVDNEIP